jgi:hypothetical protein
MQLPEPLGFFIEPLESLGLSYAITGSIAAGFYGEPRTTFDVDIVLLLQPGHLALYREAFPEEQFYVPPAEVLMAEATRRTRGSFNLIHHTTGYKADVYIANRDELHQWALRQRRRLRIGGGELWVAPPEYVILRKLEFYREGGGEKHVRDIQKMRDQTELDLAFIQAHVQRLGLNDEWTHCGGSAT